MYNIWVEDAVELGGGVSLPEGCDQGNEVAVTGEIWPHITIAIAQQLLPSPLPVQYSHYQQLVA